MKYEWDERKRRANVRKHAIDFQDAIAIFESDIVTMEDGRFDYGEVRYITLGLLNDQVIVIVHTEDENVIRLISARKATRYEQKIYFERFFN